MHALVPCLLLLLLPFSPSDAQSVPTPSLERTFCSTTQPCETGFACHVGRCVAIGTCDPPCGPKQVCHADYGVCFSDSEQPCASDNPDGYCDDPLYYCYRGACTYGGRAACSTSASTPLMGECGWGRICQLGQCIDRNGACSYSNLKGRCPTGSDCVNGNCVGPTGSLGTCSTANPSGSCTRQGEVCAGGACVVPASPDCGLLNPLGVCPTGQRCVGSECVPGAPTPAPGADNGGSGTPTPTPTTPGSTTEFVYCACSCNGMLAPGFMSWLSPGPCTSEQCSSVCWRAMGIMCSATGYTGSGGGTGTIFRGVVTGQCTGPAGSGSGAPDTPDEPTPTSPVPLDGTCYDGLPCSSGLVCSPRPSSPATGGVCRPAGELGSACWVGQLCNSGNGVTLVCLGGTCQPDDGTGGMNEELEQQPPSIPPPAGQPQGPMLGGATARYGDGGPIGIIAAIGILHAAVEIIRRRREEWGM